MKGYTKINEFAVPHDSDILEFWLALGNTEAPLCSLGLMCM